MFISPLTSLSYSVLAFSSHPAAGLGSLGTYLGVFFGFLVWNFIYSTFIGGNCRGVIDFWRSHVALVLSVSCTFAFGLVHVGRGSYLNICCCCLITLFFHWKGLQCSRVAKFIRVGCHCLCYICAQSTVVSLLNPLKGEYCLDSYPRVGLL